MAKLKTRLCIAAAILLGLLALPRPTVAAWPPLSFQLNHTHQNGKITYNLKLGKRSNDALTDLVVKIPLPAGTRFVEANAQPTTSVTFDGAEITFFTSVLHRPIRNATFVVEITNPTQTNFTTHAWLAWKGQQPGQYLSGDYTVDITRQPLNWTRPRARLRLEAQAVVNGPEITYRLYPQNIGERRMWDLQINLPLPAGTTLVDSQAPAIFSTGFNGQEISFKATELAKRLETEPLQITVSTSNPTGSLLTTHAWATWKNVGRSVGRRVVMQEDTRTGDIVVQPHTRQYVTADTLGDTPFANYDLTSLSLQEDATSLQATFYTAGPLTSANEHPLEYYLYIDADCNLDTGAKRGNRGAEYWVRYRTQPGQSHIYRWDSAENRWSNRHSLEADAPPAGKTITVWVPFNLLAHNRQFCWLGRARNRTDQYDPNLPSDWLGVNPRTTQYQAPTGNSNALPQTVDFGPPPASTPTDNGPVASALPPIRGKLAVPLKEQTGRYNVHIFSLPDGRELAQIAGARQPNFHPDGQRVLVKRETEAIYEYNLANGTQKQVSQYQLDSHPFYDPWGNRVVYSNPALIIGPDGRRTDHIFVQCGLRLPAQETEQRCRNIAGFGVLVPAGQMAEIQGSHPLWADDDRIVYKGCNSWAGAASCGIYSVPASSTKGFSDGFVPHQLTTHTGDIPTSTRGNLIAFMSSREAGWNIYLIDTNGDGLNKIAPSSGVTNGLPTLSPAGQWLAFVSDRADGWAVWVAPVAGGPAEKLFDLPGEALWVTDAGTWTDERLAWGP